jgi:hypothetical protein
LEFLSTLIVGGMDQRDCHRGADGLRILNASLFQLALDLHVKRPGNGTFAPARPHEGTSDLPERVMIGTEKAALGCLKDLQEREEHNAASAALSNLPHGPGRRSIMAVAG